MSERTHVNGVLQGRSLSMPDVERLFEGGGHGASVALRQGTPEMDYFVARSAIESGENLSHGLDHLAELLALDPAHPEWYALLERYEDAARPVEETKRGWRGLFSSKPAAPRGLVQLLSEESRGYYAAEAIRAWAMWREGESERALDLLLAVAQAKRDSRYVQTWALDWVEPDGVFESLPAPLGLQVLGMMSMTFSEAADSTTQELARVRRVARIAARYAATHELDARADMIVSGAYRRAGMVEEGLRFLDAAVAARPSWPVYNARALFHRHHGDPADAEADYIQAAKLDEQGVSSLLELGDMRFEKREWERAMRAYDDALARDPGNDWAMASTLWCQWRLDAKDDGARSELPHSIEQLAVQRNRRVMSLLTERSWYNGYVPIPAEAFTNTLAQALSQGFALTHVTLSDVESPSNLVVNALHERMQGNEPQEYEINFLNVASPDPREPASPVAHTLWRREREHLVPATRPPSDEVAEAVAELARADYDAPSHWAMASRIAARLGEGAIEDLLATIGHPPLPEEPEVDPIMWVVRVQHAAAQIIAHAGEGRWYGSARRQALMSLLLGPRDWSTSAAIVALARLVDRMPWIAMDVHAGFDALAAARADSGAASYERTLYRFWLNMPMLFESEHSEIVRRLDELEAQ